MAYSTTFIPADHPLIRYTGRWDMTDSLHPKHSWPGVFVTAAFTGTRIGIRMTDGTNYYNVYIDGNLRSVLHASKPGEADYPLADGLTDASHVLVLSKRNICFDQVFSMSGLLLDDGAKLLPLPPRPAKRIEFIGDSFTAAESNEATAQSLPWEERYPVTNIDKGFAPLIARHYGAEYHTTCRSGSGMVCDWQGMRAFSIPALFDLTLMERDEPKWDFRQWVPDLAIVILGLNDHSGLRDSSGSVPNENTLVFRDEYHRFVERLRALYPGVTIVAVAAPPEWIRTNVRQVVAEERAAGRTDIHYTQFDEFPGGYVANGHPTVETHAKIAEQIIAGIDEAIPFLAANQIVAQPRMDTVLTNDWKFARGDVPGAQTNDYPDEHWQVVSLPHTWNAQDGQDGGNDYYRGAGWYRVRLNIPPALRKKQLYLKFDAASTAAEVYVNGVPAGKHKGGFAAFCFDITPLVKLNEPNILAVKVTNARDTTISPLSGDFTVFGGLYRNVHLLALDDLCISPVDDASPGVYITQQHVTPESAELQVTSVVRNSSGRSRSAVIRCTIADSLGAPVQASDARVTLDPHSQHNVSHSLTMASPRLWNGRIDPYLYKVTVEVLENDEVKDRVIQPLGLRFFTIDPEQGFFLNGRPYTLHGVNRHQDRENMGWAIGPKEHEEDFRLIEELGCSAVRLAHYQHAQEFYELCDRGGMVVWAELALVDFVNPSTEFAAVCRQQLTELIKQNYNHPSIVLWSMYNELIPDNDRPLYGRIVGELNTLAKHLDSTRLTVAASRGNYGGGEFINTITDVIGYNLYKGWYEGSPEDLAPALDALHQENPRRAFCISEYGAGAGTTQHEVPPHKPKPSGLWHPEEWQSHLHEVSWSALSQRPFVWGTFVWNMFDFASDGRSEGERPGRNDKGLVTGDRKVKKDAFFFYKAQWNPEPMVYISSRRFEKRPAGTTEIRVYSNCDSVSLSVNGTSAGTQSGAGRVFVWKDVVLTSGENAVEARGMKDGKEFKDACVWKAE